MTSRSFIRVFSLTVATVLFAAPFAQAAIMGTVQLIKDPSTGPAGNFGNPDAALPAPWVSYALGLNATAGELIGGIDVKFTGQFHQRWSDTDDDGIYEVSGNSANATNGDTHLRAATGALFGAGPTEDNNVTASPLADTATADYGVGTNLSGAWGIQTATTSATVAYLVVRKGSEVNTDIDVLLANPNGDPIGHLTEADFPGFGIPEPATLTLLALSLIGFIGLRRR